MLIRTTHAVGIGETDRNAFNMAQASFLRDCFSIHGSNLVMGFPMKRYATVIPAEA